MRVQFLAGTYALTFILNVSVDIFTLSNKLHQMLDFGLVNAVMLLPSLPRMVRML
jgi:hypothetical protein